MTSKTNKNIDLEDLIAQTEQKILNNEYWEDTDVIYKDLIVHVRIKPISQKRFVEITNNKRALETAEFNSLLIKECVLNKHDNKPFTLEQINKLFSGGLATAIALKCCEVSGIVFDSGQLAQLRDF